MKNVFYFKKISSIGGVESMFFYLSTLYSNMVVYYKEADEEQIKRLAHNIEVHKFKGEKIKCDRFFCNYRFDIGEYVEAKEYYHIIHCDYKKTSLKPLIYNGFNYIGVSKLACNSFEELTGIKAELIYNPVVLNVPKVEKKKDKIHLISATRLSSEKGGDRIIKLAEMLDNAGIEYDWKVYSNRHLKKSNPNIIKMDTKLDLTKEIAESTYLVQLSDHEAFGLSVVESLMLGTPVIVTDLPAFKEIGCIHGKNSIICDLDMKNVDIDLIKKGLPKFTYKPPKSNWGKYLDNESKYNPNKMVEVMVKKKWWDLEKDIHYTVGNKTKVRAERASYLECLDIVEIL